MLCLLLLENTFKTFRWSMGKTHVLMKKTGQSWHLKGITEPQRSWKPWICSLSILLEFFQSVQLLRPGNLAIPRFLHLVPARYLCLILFVQWKSLPLDWKWNTVLASLMPTLEKRVGVKNLSQMQPTNFSLKASVEVQQRYEDLVFCS